MTTGDSTSRTNASGIIFVVLTLLGWSTVLLFLRYLAPHIDGWTANGWRYGMSALMWLPVLAWGALLGTLPAGLWRRAIPPSIVNCAGQVCFAWSVYYIDPGLAAFLLRVSLIFSTLGALLLFADERVLMRTGIFWGGMALVAGGSAETILLGANPIAGGTATGILLGAAAGAFFGLYGVAVRYWMRGVPSMISFGAIATYTATGMITLMILLGKDHGMAVLRFETFGATLWMVLVVSAVIGIALGHVFYYASIARLGVAVAAAVVQLAPFLCGAMSVVIYDEVLTPWQWGSGIVLLIGGCILLRAEQLRPRGAVTTQKGFPVELEDVGDPAAMEAERAQARSEPRPSGSGQSAHGNGADHRQRVTPPA